MDNPIIVISSDYSFLAVYSAPEKAERAFLTQLTADAGLGGQKLHVFDGLGRLIDVTPSERGITFADSARDPEPDDLRARIGECIRLKQAQLGTQTRLPKGVRLADLRERLETVHASTNPDVPLPTLTGNLVENLDPDAGQAEPYNLCWLWGGC